MSSLAEKYLPKAFRNILERIFDANNGHRAGRPDTVCSTSTRRHRRSILLHSFAELWELGYKLQDPRNLGGRHIEALTNHWRVSGTCLVTWHTKLSAIRTFAGWIGKSRMVGNVSDYFPGIDTRRRTAEVENHAWRPNGVLPEQVIERAREIDQRFAMFLELQDVFGLRVKESIEIRPARCLTENEETLEIYSGTKGGRPRRIRIETERQREVFEKAREMASHSRSGRLRWPDTTWRQAQRRYYHLAEKLGITKSRLGVTSHGLRHGYAQKKYIDLTGEMPPVMGGDPKRMDSQTYKKAGQHIARDLGHGRPEVGVSYYGSYGHALRGNSDKKTKPMYEEKREFNQGESSNEK